MKITKEMAQAMQAEAQVEHTEREEAREDGPPIVWMQAGSYFIRPYPEFGDGRLLTMETITAFKYDDLGWFVDNDNGDLQKEYERAKSNTPRNPWKLGPRETGKLRCAIMRSDIEDREYLKLNEPVVFVGGFYFINEWKKFVAGLQPETIMELFDPDADSPMIRIDYSFGNRDRNERSSCTISISTEKAVAPELPDDFPSVTKIFVTKDSLPTDEQISKIRRIVSQTVSSNVRVVDAVEATPPVSAATAADAFSSPTPQATETSSAVIEKAECAKEEVKSENPELSFGNRPADPGLACIMCQVEKQCMEATAQRK